MNDESLFKRHKVPDNHWLKTHKEYLRWRKTSAYDKWVVKQFLRQGGTCYYCDLPLSGGKQNVEHVMPKIKGGSNKPSNLVLACWKCNKDKYTNVLSQKTRKQLKKKNKAKRGTYTKLKELYPTEIDVALQLRDMFRED